MKKSITTQGYLVYSLNSMKTSGIPFLENIEYEAK
jgi:hypothetical protein